MEILYKPDNMYRTIYEPSGHVSLSAAAYAPIHAYEVFVGRQPIYTQQLDVFAYELLFRSGEMQHAGVTDGNQATAHVLVNTFSNLVSTRSSVPNAPLSI